MNDVIHERLGIAEQHQRLVEIIERIVDTGEARTHAALDDHDRTGFIIRSSGRWKERVWLPMTRLSSPISEDVVDFYRSCNETPVDQDRVQQQRLELQHRWANNYED